MFVFVVIAVTTTLTNGENQSGKVHGKILIPFRDFLQELLTCKLKYVILYLPDF